MKRRMCMNKRQKKSYSRKEQDSIRREVPTIWTGIGMTKSKWKKFNETLKEIFETTEYDHNTRNVENFNRLMRKR